MRRQICTCLKIHEFKVRIHRGSPSSVWLEEHSSVLLASPLVSPSNRSCNQFAMTQTRRLFHISFALHIFLHTKMLWLRVSISTWLGSYFNLKVWCWLYTLKVLSLSISLLFISSSRSVTPSQDCLNACLLGELLQRFLLCLSQGHESWLMRLPPYQIIGLLSSLISLESPIPWVRMIQAIEVFEILWQRLQC